MQLNLGLLSFNQLQLTAQSRKWHFAVPPNQYGHFWHFFLKLAGWVEERKKITCSFLNFHFSPFLGVFWITFNGHHVEVSEVSLLKKYSKSIFEAVWSSHNLECLRMPLYILKKFHFSLLFLGCFGWRFTATM